MHNESVKLKAKNVKYRYWLILLRTGSCQYGEGMKRVFIVHGWYGHSQEAWFPWLKGELEKVGVAVEVPDMKKPDQPEIEVWVEQLRNVVDRPDQDTFLVGHSMGGQTIMRYLQTMSDNERVGGVLMVGSFVNLLPAAVEDEEDELIAKPWLTTPINWETVKQKSDKFTAVFSDNDPYVPLSDKDIFADELGAKVVVLHGLGHMGGNDSISELPVVKNELIKLMS